MTPVDLGKFPVLGVDIAAVDYERAVERILEATRAGHGFSCTALAVHGVMTGVHDPEHLYRLNALDLVVPDGQPVRWALRWLHRVRLPDRVYGPALMLALLRSAEKDSIPVFLFGSRESTLVALSASLQRRFPNLTIAGQTASRFRTLTDQEATALTQEIKNSGARLVFVGLGCPRQEVWAYEFAPRLQMPVVAVGAAFDFHAGNLRQAPHWMQRVGLEWLFRLGSEPSRLWRRYLLLNPEFLARVAAQRLGIGHPAPARVPESEILYG